jgi:hypothetical protein
MKYSLKEKSFTPEGSLKYAMSLKRGMPLTIGPAEGRWRKIAITLIDWVLRVIALITTLYLIWPAGCAIALL